MPLKAKVTPPPPARGFATTTAPRATNESRQEMLDNLVEEQPGDEPDDVLFGSQLGLRTIELNRPKKLNSLNASMARKILARLKEYEKSDLANIILISGAGRAFCAGGDVAWLAQTNQKGEAGSKESTDYFGLEYKLDHLIASYKKPYIAFIDGITMGGGVGLSVHAPFRIATQNTVFAMPETTIGFFPDVGASFFLTRMDGGMGCYLALTSNQLKGVDVFYHGIATHYLDSSVLPALSTRLSELQFRDTSSLSDRNTLIASTLAEFSSGLPSPKPQISGYLRKLIDFCFDPADHPTPQSILSDLARCRDREAEGTEIRIWAEKTIATIKERSPVSVAVTLRQMQIGRRWNIAETFRNEYNIAAHFMRHPDFVTGVTARLIAKTKERPAWKPENLDLVRKEEVDSFFTPRKGEAPLQLVVDGEGAAYREYPHREFGLPTEERILAAAKKDGVVVEKEKVVERFLERSGGKEGVREKVLEVLDRM
ncbi:3-hydroxyisobutyryl-CoA hydrolase mitochondrial precursor [Aulographum hederae CBS 113979]|uniref:3-hydroxyisobutyryl-CoA hydrolase n=1 Tax=Aulographum hederae CBS 113979 TaxID=1176131 RepID=A0A6G1H9U5_9PEZI|nr:3-hydroxyisobutyryl-CoA hydrolase mitochondrial precursor [Aulographum hederae CBS 113979]